MHLELEDIYLSGLFVRARDKERAARRNMLFTIMETSR